MAEVGEGGCTRWSGKEWAPGRCSGRTVGQARGVCGDGRPSAHRVAQAANPGYRWFVGPDADGCYPGGRAAGRRGPRARAVHTGSGQQAPLDPLRAH
eukprot:14594001-Alexandrium_andersonii.AAC.1